MASATSRRDFLRTAALASGSVAVANAEPVKPAAAKKPRPNVLMVCADQFRADFIGAHGENPSTRTPHLNALAARGTMFRKAVSVQPLCSPSRASFLTSRYATEAGVWKLGLELDHSLPTIATEFHKNGYTTAFVGKWHVSSDDAPEGGKQLGWIPPGPSRGGFEDLWEGANVLEIVSHPTHGSYWDDSGKDIGFQDEYRVDFVTDRAIGFLEQKHEKPWFLFLSQLEPHHQNDIDQFVAPQRYEKSFEDPHVPADLVTLPGNWQSHLPGYYGCVQAIDDCIGRLVESLAKTGQLENTVILFFSDHGCTFRTRMGEYKRAPHDSAIRVPFIVAGPGFDQSQIVDEIVTLLDLTPTLLDSAGITPPSSMRGRSLLPLISSSKVRSEWGSTAYIQISASMCARALRTPDWCYCVYDPNIRGDDQSHSTSYTELALYSISGDPSQHTNLIGRPQYKEVTAKLREELQRRITDAGEPAASIAPAKFFI
ncbi:MULTISPECIES: sulfatase-like hydrolase/transferase [Acidobacteriaceae]|uniref:sulfatase-like hydrolase/transferase n=1 Tax=Acidobacteriaceae TaxID=204434 RepID=UPI00131B3814|nr:MULTISPECIES: sulfatase-like hydrolase/transferase [Acidobacteriaceae]MDW5264688.1 sulfatase-like hydrolase/transferase [Edaphobacter sp.]